MKTAFFALLTLPLILADSSILAAQPNQRQLSLRLEIEQAIARGNNWLQSQQREQGHWDDAGLPAFTALALMAAVRDPNYDITQEQPPHIKRGYDWLLAQQKPNGGIFNRGLTVYNTAIAVTALLAPELEEYEPAIVRARRHLIENQWDIDQAGTPDNPNDGGIGYGSNDQYTDLSNTYFALEAIALSQHIVDDGQHGDQPNLDWDAALTFLSRCQNLTQTNDMKWASDDPQNKGGFIYNSLESKAGEMVLEDGKVALRSYGSMSYAGLLSLIYARLTPSDPRVVAVKEWLSKNFSVEENPGLGAQGLYYYYQAMAKALSAAGIDELELADGQKVDWRHALADRLLQTQREDGSWVNDNGRWMESNPVLVTAYSVLALIELHRTLK